MLIINVTFYGECEQHLMIINVSQIVLGNIILLLNFSLLENIHLESCRNTTFDFATQMSETTYIHSTYM